MSETLLKSSDIAKLIEGKVVDDTKRVEICIKGTVLGFPVTLEAFRAGFPFNVNYFVETEVVDFPNKEKSTKQMKITVVPQVARGFMGKISKLLLFNAEGQPIDNKRFQSMFAATYNRPEDANRFINYPGILDSIVKLNEYTHFTELTVKAGAGLYLAQPTNFNDLKLDTVREAVRLLGEIGQILFEAF